MSHLPGYAGFSGRPTRAREQLSMCPKAVD
jgi:hypothetical protein